MNVAIVDVVLIVQRSQICMKQEQERWMILLEKLRIWSVMIMKKFLAYFVVYIV